MLSKLIFVNFGVTLFMTTKLTTLVQISLSRG